MREIRFRAFDKNKLKMIHDWQDSIWTEYSGFDGGDDFHVMQYTGLKDVDGKDIYEGDILGDLNAHCEECRSQNAVVEFGETDDARIGFHVNGDSRISIICGLYIIGNIYESPELLK